MIVPKSPCDSSFGPAVKNSVSGLPFEPVNRPRLARLKAERLESRQLRVGAARFVDKRRHAQIAARHALQRLGVGLETRGLHAAELQLPEAWLPFVGSRQG